MEFEERNPQPETKSSGLPMVVLFVLIGIICMLLYAGWNMMSDDASKVSGFGNEQLNEKPIMADSIASMTQEPTVQETTHPVVEESLPAKTSEITENKATEKEKVTEYTGESTTYTVKAGETFYGIANRFNLSASSLKNANPTIDLNNIKVGVTKVKVPIQAIHTVGPGDVLRVVGKKYNVTVEQLMAANSKTKNFAERGEKLIIPKVK